jgi:hypothetical protein
MASEELKNAGGSELMNENNFWNSNLNNHLSSLKSQTLPWPRRKLPTDCRAGSNRIWSFHQQNVTYTYFRCFLIIIKHPAAGSLVQSFENHGQRSNLSPPMGFRDKNAFYKNNLPHVKKKIPPKVGDFVSVSDSDTFDHRNYCHELNTNGFKSMFPNHEFEMPNVSPQLSESSKSLSLAHSHTMKQPVFWMMIWLVILLI